MYAALHQAGIWLASSSVNAWARSMANTHVWLIPVLQGVHILAACVIVGSAGVLGLRLARGAESREAMQRAGSTLLPWMWGALAVQIATGAFMVAHRPTRAFDSLMFPYKMMMLIAAVVLATIILRRLRHGEGGLRILGWASLLLWVGVVLAGRLISYIRAV